MTDYIYPVSVLSTTIGHQRDEVITMPVTAHDVAQYVLQKTGRIQAIKLQKLCYLADGWHLTWLNDPLFPNTIKAWKYGPVITDLYRFHKGEIYIDSWDFGEADAGKLNDNQKLIIDAVIEKNQYKDGFDLVRETHTHQIWKDKFENAPDNLRGHQELTVEDIRKQFDVLDQELIEQS
ncbi:Panacea domain-containing protein [Brevibacterium sp. 50QC2O2]|uniref:Panacea domain-containing protein n=1 Tax=Brevibacterium sp. 50QC2O2 TaxID=2968459 RepID=UPI00211C914A|nr:Panacea domain-containing protein [Brevibacterium sp. 50QC2O2]MCQ9388109.1 Panacea domain-containing protein [Brevibacterium sp. 50QC2O2]